MIRRSLYQPLTDDDQVFFMHIQKTAGSTFTRLLRREFPTSMVASLLHWDDFLALPAETRCRCQLYHGHLAYGFAHALPKMPYILTVLRDPFARIISHINHLQRDNTLRLNKLFETHTLEEILVHPSTQTRFENLQVRAISSDETDVTHAGAVYRPMTEDDLERAKKRLEMVTFFGLVEEWDMSLALLAYTFGWRRFPPDLRLNVNPRDRWIAPQQMSAQAQAQIERHIELDRLLYAHAQMLFQQRLQLMREDLLARHFEAHIASLQPETEQVLVNLGSAVLSEGWHTYEAGTDSRWTGETSATLYLHLARDRALRLEFWLRNALSQEILDGFHVRINEHRLSLTSEGHPQGGLAISGVLTPDMLTSNRPITHITFCVPHTLRPCDLDANNPDGRELGVALSAIRVTPA